MPQHKNLALIMAGGTGGHIFPGLAVASELTARGWQVEWLGSVGGMEEKIINQQEIPLHLIQVKGLRGKGLMGWFKAPFSLTKAIYQAVQVIKKQKPNIIIGFGGFAAGPGGIAAFLARVPLVIHEQNAIAGMTNRILAKFSQRVFQGFPDAFLAKHKVITVGNPVRKEIKAIRTNGELTPIQDKRLKILIVGGSRGALALNRCVPKILAELINQKVVIVKHQVGAERVNETLQFYQQANIHEPGYFELFEFIDDMAAALYWADLVICRAGASTVAEVAVAGKCAIFIPFPYAVDDHQTANANWLVNHQAAMCISESELMNDESVYRITQLIENPEKIQQMASKAKQIAYTSAAEQMADYCDKLKVKAA
ncbi:undecaprenyldiphospho-muramoylpentapeptide beta-N-acetylglucosaminyltransferase [Aliikangiella maris]|uniref:Undecaprenyldiphospho-muramoylpentapeptide beta-N-acetylglucosaminyltransferase n=2 Tax=Aliikangiella maris TaxID=3162458 RepID=A0ABV3MJ75_9GAMM